MSGLDMFPLINPDIEEIIKQEDVIDPEEVVENDTPITPADKIFVSQTQRVRKTRKPVDNINMEITDGNSNTCVVIEEDSDEELVELKQNKKQKKYSHLKKAREKGLLKRRANALKKKELKELDKIAKEKVKVLKRAATKERNKVKARERYRRIKAETAQVKPEVSKPIPIKKPVGMSFDTFSKYMNEYEKRKPKPKAAPPLRTVKRQVQPKLKVVEKPYHPKNYPLAHIYNQNRNRTFF